MSQEVNHMRTVNCRNCGLCSVNATIVSTHNTSEGLVRYLRCLCGTTQYIEIVSFVTLAAISVRREALAGSRGAVIQATK